MAEKKGICRSDPYWDDGQVKKKKQTIRIYCDKQINEESDRC